MHTPVTSQPRSRWRAWPAVTLACAVALLLPWLVASGPGGRMAEPLRGIGLTLATIVEAALFAVAGRRAELPARMRRTLWMLAAGAVFSSSCYPAIWLGRAGISQAGAYLSFFLNTGSIAIWATGAAALLMIPAAPWKTGDRERVVIDSVVTAGGLALVMWVIAIKPAIHLESADRLGVARYTVLQCIDLLILASLLVRGVTRPVRRAVWCLLSTVVFETVTEIAILWALLGGHDYRPSEFLLLADHLAYGAAGVFFLADPVSDDSALAPEWLRVVNPLPALALVGVCAMTPLAVTGRISGTLELVIGLMAMSLLLAVRSWLSGRQALALMESERQVERQAHEQKLAAVSRLAAGVAHEFNNLMTPVMGYASLALAEPDAPPVLREYLEPISSAAERSINLTRRLVEYTGSRRMTRRPTELNALLTRVQPSIEQLAGGRIETEWRLATAPLVSNADATQVEFVVTELVRNACEAVQAAGRVAVRLWPDEIVTPLRTRVRTVAPGRYAVIEVTDTGCGIPGDDLDRVFDPFFSSHPFHEGRGLGLSAVRGIVDAHSGGIDVFSGPGMGSRFRVYLPLVDVPAPVA